MKLIIARNADGCIDFRTPLIDRQRYQALTIGATCIYGKTTWDTLPLIARKGRSSIILRTTLTDTYAAPIDVQGGSYYADQLENAVNRLKGRTDVWVCGGKKVYDAVLAHHSDCVDLIYLSTFSESTGGALKVDLPFDHPCGPERPISIVCSADGAEKWERLCFQRHDAFDPTERHVFEIWKRW